MLKFLASVSPIAVLLIGALPSLAIGWGAREAKFAWLDRPAIIREATATADGACAIRTMDAANRAEGATRALLQSQYDEAFRIFREAIAGSQKAAAHAQSRLQEEIAAYGTELAAEGRSCPVTQRDLDWVRADSP